MKSISCGSHIPDSYFLSVEHKEEMKWSTERWAGWQGKVSSRGRGSQMPVLHVENLPSCGGHGEGAGGLQPGVPASLASGLWM